MSISYRVLYCRTVVVLEVQQVENRIFWCGFGFHRLFASGSPWSRPSLATCCCCVCCSLCLRIESLTTQMQAPELLGLHTSQVLPNNSVCIRIFDIPLHAARRAMAAAPPLPKQGDRLFCPPPTGCCLHTRAPLSPSPHTAGQRKKEKR